MHMFILVFPLVSGLQVHSKYLLALLSLAIYLARPEEVYEDEGYDGVDAN